MPADDLSALLSLPANRGLAIDVAERLRAAILGGHFGPGERLREEALAGAMGVSRGPVREALLRLEREGLLVIRRNRGGRWRTASPSRRRPSSTSNSTT
jgi:DNA-binding GntR family transcriptional regulator